MHFGRAIQFGRVLSGLTQTQLAKQLDCSANYLSCLESDRKQPSITMIEDLCKVFNISTTLFFFMASSRVDKDKIPESLRRMVGDMLYELFINAPKGG